MSAVTFVVSTLSISLGLMTLGLSVAFLIFHKDKWCKWYIVFQSCLVLTIFLIFTDQVTASFLSEKTALVFNFIFTIMQHLIIGFVLVLLPYFLVWIIEKKWTVVEKGVFFTAGVCYFAAGLVGRIVDRVDVAAYIQAPLFGGVLLYCTYTVCKNLPRLKNGYGRKVFTTLIIVTLSLLPTEIAVEFFPIFKPIGFPIYVLAFSLIMMVFFFVRFSSDKNRISGSITLSDEYFSQFKISEREVEVIKLICEGKTNKEIADEMNLSVNTVNNHVANIFVKMNIKSRVDLVRVVKNNPWS